MNGSFFIDTNIAIYLLAGNQHVTDLLDGQLVCLSFVTEPELLSKPAITPDEEEQIKAFLDQCIVIDFLPLLKETVVDFRRRYQIKLPDAIVAATAYQMGLPLITADKGFSRIDELTLLAVEL